jgi:hypothetical protein
MTPWPASAACVGGVVRPGGQATRSSTRHVRTRDRQVVVVVVVVNSTLLSDPSGFGQ